MRVAKHLSEDIGPRIGGSDRERQAADYLASELSELGLEVEIEPFKFLGWEPLGELSVQLLAPQREQVTAALCLYSDSTLPHGVSGRLKRVGTAYISPGLLEFPKYAIVDNNDQEAGYLIGCLGSPAIPLPNHLPLFLAPTAMIGEEDHLRFETWLQEGQEVYLSMHVEGRFIPGLVSQNVIATVQGQAQEEIVVCAHYDSAYRSPGADDNASGVNALVRLAERMKSHKPRKTLRFIAFGAEEWGILGSHYYVEQRKERGTLGLVQACLDLDMIGVGDHLWLWAGPDEFRIRLKEILDRSEWTDRLAIEYDTPKSGSDHQYFYAEGIPSIVLIFWPYDYYHQPLDTVDHLSGDVMGKTIEVGAEIVKWLEVEA